MMTVTGRELRSTVTEDGTLRLTLENVTLDPPSAMLLSPSAHEGALPERSWSGAEGRRLRRWGTGPAVPGGLPASGRWSRGGAMVAGLMGSPVSPAFATPVVSPSAPYCGGAVA